MPEAIESIIIDALNEDGFELYSASTLVLIDDRARSESAAPPHRGNGAGVCRTFGRGHPLPHPRCDRF